MIGCKNLIAVFAKPTFMRSTLRAFFYLMAMLLSGCATDEHPQGTATGFAEKSCPPDKALVYLYRIRPWVGQGKDIMMCVNYVPTVSLAGHEYCQLILQSGLTQIGHQYRDIVPPYGIPAETKKQIDLRMHLEAGKTYYVAYRFSINPFNSPSPTMVLVDRETAANEMSTCSIKKPICDSP